MSLWIWSSYDSYEESIECYANLSKTALRYDVPRDFDLLTIDTDYNDYWTKANVVGFTLRSSVAFSSWCCILLISCNRWKDLACPADGWHLQTTCMFLTMSSQCLLGSESSLGKVRWSRWTSIPTCPCMKPKLWGTNRSMFDGSCLWTLCLCTISQSVRNIIVEVFCNGRVGWHCLYCRHGVALR